MSGQNKAAETVLRRFLHCAGQADAASEFMMMGAVVIERGTIVHLYKHIETRRVLALDASGHAYSATASLHSSPQAAMLDVIGQPDAAASTAPLRNDAR